MAKKTAIAIVKAADYDLDEKRAVEIQSSFQPMIAEREVLAKEFEIIISQKEVDGDLCQRAGALRRQLVKVRTGISEVHRSQKHLFLQAGRFVDAWKNAETLPVSQMEDKLSAIETHFENIEAAKIATIQNARIAKLREYEVPDELIPAGLGQMVESVWENYLCGVVESHRQRKERERLAEKELAAKVKAEAVERERLRVENEQLKADADAREKAEAARIAKEKKAEAARKKEHAEGVAKLLAEREEREKLENEKADREAAELKEIADTAARLKNKKHRTDIDKAAIEMIRLIDIAFGEYAVCDKLIRAIANGEIPNVTINY